MKRFKRILATVLSVAILLSSGILPIGVWSVEAEGTDPVTTTETIIKNGISYTFTRKIQYVSGRTYNVSVDVSSNLTSTETANRRTVAKSGYMTVEQTGWYILELWGGDGGDGRTSDLNLAPDGEGGRGGYVYGKVYLEKGQTLAYSIGTNGAQSLTDDDGSGGANGSGGTHGDSGSVYVGGGGGFSALFLFDEGDFNPGWFNDKDPGSNVWANMPEDVRLSRYLMIAGGGGGGGAAPWITGLLGWAINGEVYAPDGGYGGRMSSSYITLSGSSYDVEGYVFSGRDGYSSGESTAFVGQGGSTVPGAVLETAVGWFESSVLPNDWTGTYSSESSFGAGGSGNFRGGAGGAGFAGGSGGIMEGALLATNIGGGGGGSSFLASSANGKDIGFLFQSGSEELNYLMGYNNQPVGEDYVGGAMAITYMGADDSLTTESFEGTSVTLNVTDNFYIFNNVSTNQSNAAINLDADGSSVTVGGLSIMPGLGVSAPATAHIQMQVIARDAFAGGNGVKLLDALTVQVKNPDPTNGEGDTYTFTFQEETDQIIPEFYVNVPLNLVAKANFLTANKPGTSFKVSQLYTDQFASIRSDLTADRNYAFIESIGTYSVSHMDGTALTGSVTPDATTYYTVGYDVAVKSGTVETEVGPKVTDCRIIGTAVISVVPVGQAYLSGLSVNVSKSLSYADGVYTYKLEETQNAAPQSLPNYSVTKSEGEAGDITVEHSGWYYIQAWGGDGGAGGSAYIEVNSDASSSSRTESVSGIKGGSGGAVAQYVYLTAGTKLTVAVGTAGSAGTRTENVISPTADTVVGACGTGGGKGTATTVKIGNDTLMIAGGGAGAGGSTVVGFTCGNRGRYFDRTDTDYGDEGPSVTTTNSTLSGTYDGTDGDQGSFSSRKPLWVTYVDAYGGPAGSAGKNYKNSSYDSTTQQGHTLTETAKAVAQELKRSAKTGTGGQVTVTLIETQEMEDARSSLGTMETDIAFSQYFDVLDVSMKTTYDASASFAYTKTVTADGSNTVVHIYDTRYEPGVTLTKNDNGYLAQYYATVVFTFQLKPKEGFLGGNDVPVVVRGQLNCGNDTQEESNPDNGIHITQGGESYNPPATVQTDLANVALNMELLSIFSTQNKTVHLGDSVALSELYTFAIPNYTGDDAWKDDFVEFVAPADETDAPTQDTVCPITVTLRATDQAPDALVVAPVADLTQTLGATVFVEMPITYVLDRLTADGLEWVPYNKEYQFTLVPEQGYLLPEKAEDVAVTDASGQKVASTYDPVTGIVNIPAEAVVGPLTVTAGGRVKPYNIHIIYSSYDPETGLESSQETGIKDIVPGTALSWDKLTEIQAALAEKPGYEYLWSYDSEDGRQPQQMPAHDLWVYGTYAPKTYTVTVNYVHAVTGEVLHDPAVQEAVYGQSFSIRSPAIKGYLPDLTVIKATQGLDTLTYEVKYTPSQNTLLIVYVNAKGEQLLTERYENIATDAQYSYPAASIPGYTPEVDTVSGTMPGDDSITVTVNCTPNTYTLNFVFNTDTANGYNPLPGVVISGATMEGGNTQKVEFDNVYGYNPEAETDDQGNLVGRVTGLPKPEFAGYVFAGWYSDAALTQPVSERAVYKTAADTTLYAKWDTQTFKLTVEYKFDYKDGDFVPENCLNEGSLDVAGDFLGSTFATKDDVQAYLNAYAAAYSAQHGDLKIAYGVEYTVPVPAFEGYTAYLRYGLNDSTAVTELTGNMPAVNLKIIVTYVINVYTVRFVDNGWHTVDYSDKATVNGSVYQADTFSTLWETVENVKHGAEVTYGGVTPNQATKETYTYTFTGWKSNIDDAVYPGQTPTFPAVKQNTDYYACYRAQENIISATHNGVTNYYTTVHTALEALTETQITTAVTLKFRRNSGNGTNVDLDGDILDFSVFTDDTSTLTFTVDLNALEVGSDTGATVLVNPSSSYINLSITSTGGQGTLYSRGSGDVVTATVQRQLTLSSNVVLEATSTGGTAIGISSAIGGSAPSISVGAAHVKVSAAGDAIGIQYPRTVSTGSSAAGITVESTGGKAVGMVLTSGTRTLNSMKLTVTGPEAVGIVISDGVNGTASGSSITITVNGQTSATGILVEQGGTLTCGSNAVQVTVNAANGTACGLRNLGTVTDPNVKLTVTANNGDAYGFANEGGTVTVSGEYTDLEAHATSTGGAGYGLYSNGGSVGSNGSWLDNGVISGSSYGIYCADGSIFVSGNELYFKGATEENALSDTVVIAEGYEQTEAYEPYAGYYRLARYHTITFVTNGGKEVATIRQLYGTPLASSQFVTTKRGYDFIVWHTAEDLTAEYPVPEWMPNEDLTLYAQWELVEYIYTLDTELTNMKVRFYGLKYGDTDLVTEAALATSDAALPDAVKTEERTYKDGTTLYIHAGWYTEPDGGGKFANLSGDLSALDINGDGIVELYSKWVVQTQCHNYYSNSTSTRYDFAMMGTTTDTATNLYVTGYHQNLTSSSTSTYGYGYLYYVIPKDGDYAINYANYSTSSSSNSGSSYYSKYVQIQKVSAAETEPEDLEEGARVYSFRSKSYDVITGTFEEGDVIILRTYRGYSSTSSSYNTYVYGYVTPVSDEEVPTYNVSVSGSVQVQFYGTENGNSDLVATATVTDGGIMLPDSIKDLTYRSGSTLYIHAGWYTEPDGGEFVDLSGDISTLDTDGDKIIKLYSKWVSQDNCYHNTSYSADDFERMGTTPSAASSMYVYYQQSSTSYGYGYLYYVVPKDGNYTVHYANHRSGYDEADSNYRKYVQIQKISGSTPTDMRSNALLYCNSALNYVMTDSIYCEAGDVLVLRVYRYSSYGTYLYAYVTEDIGTAEMSYEVSAPQVFEQFTYTVEMGDVTLPIPVSDSGKRFSGWSEGTASADSADWLMTLKPEMVEASPWADREVMNLHANWQDATWQGYQSADRNFSAITGTDAVTVRNNQTVTLRFEAVTGADVAKQLRFASKLPEGTVLTLVNRTGNAPSYYTYRVGAEGISTLELSEFRNMADGTAFSAAVEDDLLLQIDYAHAEKPEASQTVSLWAEAITPESMLSYSLLDCAVTNTELDGAELTYKESGTVTLDTPSLAGKGFANTDAVYLRISWGNLTMAPGTLMQVGGNSMTVFGGSCGLISLGNAGNYSVPNRVNLSYAFPTSVYWDTEGKENEFSASFTYELIVVSGTLPDNVLLSRDISTVGSFTQTVTVTPTAPVTVSENAVSAVQGEMLTLGTFAYAERPDAQEPAWYIYANVDGYLEVTNACLSLFDESAAVGDDGSITGIVLSDDGTAVLNVSADAEPGEYYLKFEYDGKYVFVQIAVTAQAPQG